MYPFWSADSHQIGFFAEGKLKTVDLSSGAVRIVCGSPPAAGAAWSDQGITLFVPEMGGLIYKVSASGGSPQPVTKIAGNQAHRWPSFLPDGNHFLYFQDTQNILASGQPATVSMWDLSHRRRANWFPRRFRTMSGSPLGGFSSFAIIASCHN